MKNINSILRIKQKFIYILIISLLIISLIFWSILIYNRYDNRKSKKIFNSDIKNEFIKHTDESIISDKYQEISENKNKNKNIIYDNKDDEKLKFNDDEIEEMDKNIVNNNDNDKENSLFLNLLLNDNNNNEGDRVENMIKKLFKDFIQRSLNPKEFNMLRKREELHTELWGSIFGINDTLMNEDELIIYKKKLMEESDFLSQTNFNNLPINKRLLAMLHQSLYPWIYGHHYNSLGDILKSSEGKGIVICVCDKLYPYAGSVVDALRYVIKTELPIEIMYNGEEDLSLRYRKFFNDFENTYVTDISTFFDNSIVGMSGWAIKPFAILASRFEEVILIDADAFYLRDPIELFNDKGYQKRGTLFFKDRTLFPGSHPGVKWLKTWMVDPLPETKELRFWNEKSRHEMESSTVVIHKTKTLLGLLNVCKLNEQKIREDVVYKNVHGDKETFWMGFDMARQSYHMNPLTTAFVGDIISDKNNEIQRDIKICGHNGHMLTNGQLFFWNGSLVKDKALKISEDDLIKFKGYFIDDNDGHWSEDLFCLTLKENQWPTYFSEEERDVYDEIIEREEILTYIVI